MKIVTSMYVEQGGEEMQDRAEIFQCGERIVVAIADGVGGISGGTLAAETFVYNVQNAVQFLIDADHCHRLLHQVDWLLAGDLNGAETTGVVAVIDSGKVFGASCGDSGARLYRHDEVVDVTPSGRSRSFLGSGNALVTEFVTEMKGTLVVATDGLWKYAKSSDIDAAIGNAAPQQLASALADLARLTTRKLQDDIAIVTCVRL